METILEIDKNLFLFLNGLHFPFLDSVMAGITHRLTWIPLYVYIIFLIYQQRKNQLFIVSFFIIVFAAGLSDFITSGLMKPYFLRLRPCHTSEIIPYLHLVGDCGGQYGFASSHAANTFSLSFSFLILFNKSYPTFSKILLAWAIIVSYSRIYVGVHFPIDIMVGAAVGFLCSLLFTFLANKFKLTKL
jgi:undecaprenyl-diphosphatase